MSEMEQASEIMAEAGHDTRHCGGQQRWLKRGKYSKWRNARTEMVMTEGLQDKHRIIYILSLKHKMKLLTVCTYLDIYFTDNLTT